MRFLPGAGFARAALVVVALAGLSACDNPMSATDDLEDARRMWRSQGITSYTFRVEVLCFCVEEGRGPFAVTVEQGRVASVTDPETGAPRAANEFVPLTVEALFDKVEDAIERDAADLDVRYDARYGYPVEVAIDFIANAIDDEVTYRASDLAPR
jgi:hypothetical protein